jgi:hypothetical protein
MMGVPADDRKLVLTVSALSVIARSSMGEAYDLADDALDNLDAIAGLGLAEPTTDQRQARARALARLEAVVADLEDITDDLGLRRGRDYGARATEDRHASPTPWRDGEARLKPR